MMLELWVYENTKKKSVETHVYLSAKLDSNGNIVGWKDT